MNDGKAIRDLDDVLAACGSVLRNARASQAKALFRDTFEHLVERGFLRTVPQFISGRRGNRKVVQVVFTPRTPPSPGLRELLTATLSRWGVIAATAAKLVEESTDWTATVVAAVMLGMIEVRKTVPSMVVNYCQHPGRVEEFLIGEMPRFDGGMGRETATGNPAMKYLESGHDHAVAFREGLTRDQLAEYQKSFRAIGRPDWVVEGLVLAALARNTTSLREYLRYNS